MGLSHETICHISQPQRQDRYCTLESYKGVLAALQQDGNNVIRLWAIFNHSPGTGAYGAPFANEQPFVRTAGKWDLTRIDETYLANLESVVCEAYGKGIVVEVTLLDPWSPSWATSPFNPVNTIDPEKQGFTERRLFASFEDPQARADGTPRNVLSRAAQKSAVAAVVSRLKKYPNVLWEVANEPDLIPAGAPDLGGKLTPEQVLDWQKAMAAVIQANDAAPPHLIEVNGHAPATFAWNVPGAKVATVHYTGIEGGRYGAIELLRDESLAGPRAGVAVGCNENRPLPDPKDPGRGADDVRAEAWEIMLGGGALFDGYSLDRSAPASQAASAQLGVLGRFLRGLRSLPSMRPAGCNGPSDWCRGIPAWGTRETGTCGPALGANLYWATLRSATDLALYIQHGNSGSATKDAAFGSYRAAVCGEGKAGSGYQTTGVQVRVAQAGCWSVEWRDPATGATLAKDLRPLAADAWSPAGDSPWYRHDVLLFVSLVRAGSCPEAPRIP